MKGTQLITQLHKMITDISNPRFNIANVSSEERMDYMIQLSNERDNGFITQDELLSIFDEWYIQFKVAKLKIASN